MYMNMRLNKKNKLFSKDTSYHFLNASHINWIRFTSLLAVKIATEEITDLTDNERVNVLIIDDTMFERASSKKVEICYAITLENF